ncbi:MAG TPA: MMPL family transporter [Steroidobacteraceae bacterium]|nr:MMPL family transporter [Steroidobacteraceae bacterium]
MNTPPPITLWVWLLLVGLASWIVARAHYVADLSAFLPRSPSPTQQLLVQQLQDGPASRLILIGIEGADPLSRAAASRALAAALRAYPQFINVNNGEAGSEDQDRRVVFTHRYLLSSAITPEHFSIAGLSAAISDNLDLITSPAGLLAKSLFRSDPTGETLQVIDQLESGRQLTGVEGVWSSADGQRALLLAQTRASGSDTDAQEQALTQLSAAFTRIAAGSLRLLVSSPGKFAVDSRATIKQQAVRLSLLSTLLIATLLLWVYRSLPTLLFGLLPVASGALAGIAAVAVGFGIVHGITLGFGVTLIGESVDYSIYLFVQSRGAPLAAPRATLWPTMLLGVATSVCGFASLLPSAFPGLAQLGLFSIAGLIAAAAVTRFVLPPLLPARVRMADLTPLGARCMRLLSHLHLPVTLWALLATGCVWVLYVDRGRLWNHDIAALSPIPDSAQRLDAQLRADLDAPDVGSLVVVSADSEQAVLQLSEAVGRRLDALSADGIIGGYDSPARYLPSERTQQARRASLPGDAPLRARLASVGDTLSLETAALEPFMEQVNAAREAPLLTRASLEGSSFVQALDALLWQRDTHWHAILPLRAVNDLSQVRRALATLAPGQCQVLNIKQETDALYGGYLSEAIRLSLAGFGAIVLLLVLTLRSTRRVTRVILPLLLAVLMVATGLALLGVRMSILHLVGMLLIVAVGSNYALFFDKRAHDCDRQTLPLTLASLLTANSCTVIGFGVLAFSSVPVLSALGSTVAPGTLLALWLSALFAPRALWA